MELISPAEAEAPGLVQGEPKYHKARPRPNAIVSTKANRQNALVPHGLFKSWQVVICMKILRELPPSVGTVLPHNLRVNCSGCSQHFDLTSRH